MLQDSKGFMWFGTFNGLNRYDGYDFKVFKYNPNDSSCLSHNYITALYEDENGNLWIGTSDGLNRYDRKMNRFKSFRHQKDDLNSISDNQIETILQDSDGRLWIGTRNGGLDIFNPQLENFTHYSYNEKKLKTMSNYFIRVLFEDSYGNVWIAHSDGTLNILIRNHDRLTDVSIHEEKLTRSRINAIVESSDKSIWIGTQGDGLYRVKYENGVIEIISHFVFSSTQKNSITSNNILCLMLEKSTLWIGTEDEGINLLNINTGTIQYYKHDPTNDSSLNHDSVWSIYEDRAGDVWIGVYAHGINLLTPRKSYFQHFKHHPGDDNCLSHDMVNSILQDKYNNLWIATDGGGLNFFNRGEDRFYNFDVNNSNIKTNVIVSLFEDRDGFLWLGTWSDGLYKFNKSTQTFIHYTKEKHGLGSNRILHIEENVDGGLWLCTFWGGLTYFNSENGTVEIYNKSNSGLSDDDVRVVLQDYHDNLWIGTDVGLDLFDPRTKTFINYKHDEADEFSISKGFIHSLIQSRDSTIWVGTTGGLNKFDLENERFVRYSTMDGLPNDEIKTIIEGEDGVIWVSTNNGISKFDTKTRSFKNYDISDGLQGNEFNARSGIRSSTNEIIFGGNNGFNIFQPDNIKDNPYVPPVVITDFKIFNESVHIGGDNSPLQKHINETDYLELSYRDAVISFEFSALNYISPEKNQYAYMMEGFESNWNYVKARRTATYTNLDPGNYVFRLKASNNDGLWNTEGQSIDIKINPPFWRTWWAYLVEIMVGLTIIAFVINYFTGRQRMKNALKIEHLQLEKMYEMDQMKTQFFANISHEFTSPLTLILSPLEKLISYNNIDDKIKSSLILVQRNARRLKRMIGQLKDIQKIETGDLQLSLSRGNIIEYIDGIVNSFRDYAEDHHIRFQFSTAQESVIVWFDPDKLDKIIYNLLSNAFKFTPDNGEISVTVTTLFSEERKITNIHSQTANKYIEISVRDNGIGIPENEIEHIFQRYYKVGERKGQRYEGSGIGLAFVHELVQLYQGQISVVSKEGEGAQFIVQIPIDENFLEENQLVGDFNVNKETNLLLQESSENNIPSIDASIMDTTKEDIMDSSVILIVEDDPEIRKYMKSSLKTHYRISSAQNGAEGLEKALKIIPDLVISDIKMPEISGTQLCKYLKNDERTSHIPVILLTAYSSHEYKIKGLSEGADAYLTKPFRIDVLETQISNLLNSRNKLKQKYSREILLGPKKIKITDIDEKFLRRIIDVIEKHISDNEFNADVLSKELGMSRMQLYRKLRGLIDQTVHEFIRNIRLKRAVQLLGEKRMTITEVAYEVGFNDLTYFARCFRKQYKKSPSEYMSQKN